MLTADRDLPIASDLQFLKESMWLEETGKSTYNRVADEGICAKHSVYTNLLTSAEIEVHDGLVFGFIPSSTDNHPGVLKSIQKLLEHETPFSGALFITPSAITCQIPIVSMPEMDLLCCAGGILKYPLILKPGIKDQCRQCKYGPLYCEICGHIDSECPNCSAKLATPYLSRDRIENASLVYPRYSEEKHTYWGKTWDGNDFCCRGISNVITFRVLYWLLHINAGPFYARPVKVCIDGMSSQQLEWLERAQQPIF